MRRLVPLFSAVVVLGALVLVTVLSAGSVDSSALGRAVAVPHPPTGSVTPPSPVACAVRSGGSDVVLRGACRGHLDGALTCGGDEDAINASLQAAVVGDRHLTISIILPDPAGPGTYDEAAVYAQLSRSGGAERWSNRATTVTLGRDGTFTVRTRLSAEIATGTPGTIALAGRMHCSDATADVLDGTA